MNSGKVFEKDFESSIDKGKILVKRFNDNAASFSGGTNTRFSTKNECDYMAFDPDNRFLYFFELKTTLSSLTFWRDDFEGKSFNIKKEQILGLEKFSKYNNTFCGLILNFRNEENNDTFFVSIQEFLEYTNNIEKKSININDVRNMKHIKINNKCKKVHYTYNVDELLEEISNTLLN